MSRRQVNLRLSDLTRNQLAELCRRLVASEATIVTVAVDRMYHQEISISPPRASTEESTNDSNENSAEL